MLQLKKSLEKLQFICIVLLVLTIPSLQANSFMINSSVDTPDMEVIDNDLLGAWQYIVENAPPEYSTGIISISNENDTYAVQVQLGTGTLHGDNVSVDGNEITFNLFIEGGSVTVVLTADGNTISGQSTSSEGVYSIAGEKVKPE